jgi:hypothetical protein
VRTETSQSAKGYGVLQTYSTVIARRKLVLRKVEGRRQEVDTILRVGAALARAQEMRVDEDRVAEGESADVSLNTSHLERSEKTDPWIDSWTPVALPVKCPRHTH